MTPARAGNELVQVYGRDGKYGLTPARAGSLAELERRWRDYRLTPARAGRDGETPVDTTLS